ncbi:AAA family ATPase [Pseudomonas aeruginosa]
MIATGKSPNTVNSYHSGVNTVSKHYGLDVFAIDDLDELERLYLSYGPKGEHAEIGASNSNNVQNGLKQWLDYQRHRQQDVGLGAGEVAIAGYADQRVLQLLNKGSPDEQTWCWTLLKCFRQRYPQADHWTVNINPPDIRIGVREKDSLKGKTVFTLYWYGRAICCSLRGIADHRALMEAQGLDWEIDSNRCPTLADMRGWFDSVENALKGRQLTLNGAGLVPSDYGQAEQEEASVTTTNTAFKPALNQILFGPPGTGKTYNTINQALAILAPEFLAQNSGDDPDSRERLKDEFDRLVAAERVRFVTFHQSFSYEDFVEGLRADSDTETGQVKYPVESGVFKRICDDARTRPATDVGVSANPSIWKISIAGTGSSPTKSYCLANGEARIGWGKTGDLREDYEQNAYYQSLGGGDKGTLNYFAEQMMVGDILLCIHSAEQIGSIGVVTSEYRYEEQVPAGVLSHYQHVRSVRWLYRDINLSILPLNNQRQFTLKTVYAMNRFTWAELLSYLQHNGVQPTELVATKGAADEPYVLIIDEINRGNVSRIFGELITLIEESKRDGAEEALSLKLPYSKKPFSVPKNVYLIGTMNTSDRSLAGLDIALRRRFVFQEMPPRPELLDDIEVIGVNIGKLLRVMNQRIEVLLDRDHCLGHAYFMPLKSDSSLQRLELIFRNQILPLLQEYFFEDWQRIQWVLNDHRKPAVDRFVAQDKQDLGALFGNISVPAQGAAWRINDAAFKRLSAYAGVIAVNGKAEVSAEEQEEASA